MTVPGQRSGRRTACGIRMMGTEAQAGTSNRVTRNKEDGVRKRSFVPKRTPARTVPANRVRTADRVWTANRVQAAARRVVLALTLALILTACGGGQKPAASARERYQKMAGCLMEAEVSCGWEGSPWTALLRCACLPDGKCLVQALSPETVRGVTMELEPDGAHWSLRYAGRALDAGAVSSEALFPASCLPRLMDALREGWLLEESRETWDGVPCARLTLDRTGESGTSIQSTLWLREADGTPLRGEIAVEENVVLTAEFTNFVFYDTLEEAEALLK